MNAHRDEVQRHNAWAQEGRQPRIAIIGAGFSGMGAIIRLRQAGYSDVTCFEQASEIGGTWRDNTYPGLSCDIPSHWYSYSFELNPDWTHRFSYGPEIHAYQLKVAEKYQLRRHIRLSTGVRELRYLGPTWRLTTDQGEVALFDFVIAATGILVHPAYPDIPGLDTFGGASFHSARWDHSVDLRGKRVGIIGTGSTACQVVGAIAADVAHLDVFQRTPHWIAPLPQTRYSAGWRAILRAVPGLQSFVRHRIRRSMEFTFGRATLGDARQQQKIEQRCLKFLRQAVPDPGLRARLTPDYRATCKRLIFCSDYYPAMMRDNVELVTEGIEAIVPEGVRTAAGEVRVLDVLVLATGFRVDDFILPTEVYGEAGLSLRDFWSGLPRAHRAMTLPGFPNFWMLQGPTGVIGNTSLIDMSEHQIDYLITCLDKLRDDRLAAIAPKLSAYEAYNASLAEPIMRTTWATGGCDSWYLDASGRPNIYPWLPDVYRAQMKDVDFSEYRLMEGVPG